MRFFLPFCIAGLLLLAACHNNSSSASAAKQDTVADTERQLPLPAARVKPLPDTGTAFINTSDSPFVLVPHPIRLQKGVSLDLNIPEGYNISVAYEGLN